MFTIDLTQDSDSEGQSRFTNPSFQTLAHRTLSSTSASVPLKRKSDVDSESISASSFRSASAVQTPVSLSNGTAHSQGLANDDYQDLFRSFKERPLKRFYSGPGPVSYPYAPSPVPEAPEIKVIIPSPSAQLRKEIDSAELITDAELTGLSEKYYPTDAHERRATKGAYPAARKTNRTVVPFSIGKPGPFLTETDRRPVLEVLTRSLKSKLASIAGPAVTVARADEQLLAENTSSFQFINEYKLRDGVSPITQEFSAGCNCRVICDPARCTCLTQEEDSNERIVPYRRAADDSRFMVLSPEFMTRTSMIYECNELCGCEEKCWNRVIKHGRTIRLEIFHTGARGFGLRSPDFLRAGQFIDLYLGEVITTEKASQREKIAAARNAPSYLFNLDFLVDNEESYVVDGANYGAATRFINHSCNPNCRMFAVSRTHGDEYLYDLAFFALREIQPGTELTFDYNPHMERVEKLDPDAVPCLCGEPNCRGQLWANERKKTTR
ncbi:histone-lysine N-methyltransferase Clr4 [Aspergillus undulatus]|uniref:histone-lysine N-methyltransferase Clr4 n=1 Tax=Aspergillus undulatus TaxID=1810928 RepID=UPI003CCD8965